MERASGDTIRKAVMLGGLPAILAIALSPDEAVCSIDDLAVVTSGAASQARHIVERLLGLNIDPSAFERQVDADAELAPLIEGRRGLRIPLTATVFEALMWAIVGQQVNLTFAYRLRRAVADLAAEPIGDMLAHPTPEAVARLDYESLTTRQFSRRKAEYLIDMARVVASGELDAEALPAAPPETVRARLMALRGFGVWSTNYVMMRGCGFPDCVPVGDTGLTSGLQRFFNLQTRPDAAATLALMERFAPFRSLATMHIWMRASETAM